VIADGGNNVQREAYKFGWWFVVGGRNRDWELGTPDCKFDYI